MYDPEYHKKRGIKKLSNYKSLRLSKQRGRANDRKAKHFDVL